MFSECSVVLSNFFSITCCSEKYFITVLTARDYGQNEAVISDSETLPKLRVKGNVQQQTLVQSAWPEQVLCVWFPSCGRLKAIVHVHNGMREWNKLRPQATGVQTAIISNLDSYIKLFVVSPKYHNGYETNPTPLKSRSRKRLT